MNSEVEEKWKRLRPMADRQYFYATSRIEIELEELEVDATHEQSKSAFYYMFNRVYNQWQEATASEKQEHEAIIDLKNSTKIPRWVIYAHLSSNDISFYFITVLYVILLDFDRL